MKQSILSEKLVHARTILRLAQSEVAHHVGCSQTTYHNWESAKHIPSMKHITKLCQILELKLDDVLPPHNHLIIS